MRNGIFSRPIFMFRALWWTPRKLWHIRTTIKINNEWKHHATGPPISRPRLSNNKRVYDLWSETDTYNGFCIKKLHRIRGGVLRLRRTAARLPPAFDMINNLKLLVKGETFISLLLYTSKYLCLIWRRVMCLIV